MSRGYGCLVGASCSSRVRGETNAPRRACPPWGVTDQSMALNEMPAWATGGSNTRLAVKAKVSTARTRTANAFTRNSFGSRYEGVADQSMAFNAMPAWATAGKHTRLAVMSALRTRTANAFMTKLLSVVSTGRVGDSALHISSYDLTLGR